MRFTRIVVPVRGMPMTNTGRSTGFPRCRGGGEPIVDAERLINERGALRDDASFARLANAGSAFTNSATTPRPRETSPYVPSRTPVRSFATSMMSSAFICDLLATFWQVMDIRSLLSETNHILSIHSLTSNRVRA